MTYLDCPWMKIKGRIFFKKKSSKFQVNDALFYKLIHYVYTYCHKVSHSTKLKADFLPQVAYLLF